MSDNKISMVVTDLDDTLLSPKKEISKEVCYQIEELHKKGIKFTFITGRPFYAIKRFMEKVLISAPIVSCNGAVILDHESGRILKATTFELDELEHLLQHTKEKGFTVLITAGEVEYSLSETDWTRARKKVGRVVPILTLEELRGNAQPIYKVNIMSDGKETEFSKCIPWIQELKKNYSITIYGNRGCEIVAKEVNKREGLIELCDLCNLSIDQVLAIGDNANDREMIQAAGIGVIVANGTEDAKEVADYVCEHSYTKGVVEAIEKFINGEGR